MTCEKATAMRLSIQTVLKNEIQFKQRVESNLECAMLAHFLLSQLKQDGKYPNLVQAHMIMSKKNLCSLELPKLDSIHYFLEKYLLVVNLYQRCNLQRYSQSQTNVSNRSALVKQH